jgi:hypothetical protein
MAQLHTVNKSPFERNAFSSAAWSTQRKVAAFFCLKTESMPQ